jgi:hypothetical protein
MKFLLCLRCKAVIFIISVISVGHFSGLNVEGIIVVAVSVESISATTISSPIAGITISPRAMSLLFSAAATIVAGGILLSKFCHL